MNPEVSCLKSTVANNQNSKQKLKNNLVSFYSYTEALAF